MKRTTRIWVLNCALGAIAAATGCASADASYGAPEPVASEVPQALITLVLPPPPRADCNSPNYPTVTVTAQNMGTAEKPMYRDSVQSLLDGLLACSKSLDPDIAAHCKEVRNYTSAIYSIPGAAGYYYQVQESISNRFYQFFLAIPITDSTTAPPLSPYYYASYPGAQTIHTPQLGPSPFYGSPQSGSFMTCDGEAPCNRVDHTSLWKIKSDSTLNTPSVSGRIKAQSCVAILDPYGNFLDFSVELEEHDPNGCGGCRHY